MKNDYSLKESKTFHLLAKGLSLIVVRHKFKTQKVITVK